MYKMSDFVKVIIIDILLFGFLWILRSLDFQNT